MLGIKFSIAVVFSVLTCGVYAAAQNPSMPQIDQSKIVTPTISEEPFHFSFGVNTYSFDINHQYLCVLKSSIGQDTVVRIFDLRDGSQVKEISMGKELGSSVSINSDLSRMLFKPKFGAGLKLLDISDKPKPIGDIEFKLSRYGKDFHFFPSPKRIVTCESPTPRLNLWNAENSKLLHNSKVRFEGIKSNVTRDGNFVYHGISDGPVNSNHHPGRVIHYIDVSTGKVAGTVTLDAPNDDCRMPRLSPDGEKMLCVSKEGEAIRTVSCFDAGTGKRLFQIPFPTDSTKFGNWKIHWLENDHFIIGNVIASVERQKILARLKDFRPKHIIESTGHAIYIDRYDGRYVQTAKNIVDEIAKVPEVADSKIRHRLKQQDAIALDFELPAEIPVRGLEGKLTTSITKALTATGFRVQKNAPVTLKLTVSEALTGKVNEFHRGSEKRGRFVPKLSIPKIKIPEIALRCLMTFSDKSGTFHEKEVFFTIPRDAIEINFLGTMEGSINNWRWNQLLAIDERYFSREYVDFDIKEVEVNFKPDEAWLAKIKKTEAAKRAAKQEAERQNRRNRRKSR